MKFKKNEDAVSELVGALMILLILVISLGMLQTYEIPKWTKEFERQQFDQVQSDLINFRSDLEDVAIKNIPKSSSLHMGNRYPERYVLRNPGPGVSGKLTTYPLNITISYDINGNINYINYTSLEIIYEMNGISDFPKLIYENGIIIMDFGKGSYTEDSNRLITKDNIFIPILMGVDSVSSMGVETFNIYPISQQDYISQIISSMNVTIETRHPEVWASLSSNFKPSGSNFSVDTVNKTISITDLHGYGVRLLTMPKTNLQSQNQIYFGTITFPDTTSSPGTSGKSSSCADPGRIVTMKNEGCGDIPASNSIQKFMIKDIEMVEGIPNAELRYLVKDKTNLVWEVSILLSTDSNGSLQSANIQQKKPTGGYQCSNSNGVTIDLNNRQIDLTQCYKNIGINTPNLLTVNKIANDILYVNILTI